MKNNVRNLLAVTIASLLPLAAAWADSVKRYNLEAQDASTGLQSLALQGNFQVFYPASLAKGRKIQEVRGEYTTAEALDVALRGTGLKFRVTDDGTYVVEERSATDESPSIETINVFGTLDNQVSVGSKTGLSLRETPKSVTIVTRERIEAQNLTTITDVLQQATGITLQSYDVVQPLYYSRGYRVETMQVDGGAPTARGFGFISSPDSAMFEHVEVLRGVDGIFSGAGDPGGVINLIRKRALSTPGLTVNTSVGRWNNYRVELDATGALVDSGSVRGRAVGVYEDKEYFWEGSDSNKKMVYAVAEADLGSATVMSLGGSYEERLENGYWAGGIGRYADGRDLKLPRSARLTADWTYADITSKEVFAKIERNFVGGTALKLNVSHQQQNTEMTSMYIKGAIDPVTLTGATATAWADDLDSKRTMVDLFMSGTLNLFSRDHSFAVGADYSKRDGDGRKYYDLTGYPWVGGPAVDVFNVDPAMLPPAPRVLDPANSHSISPVYNQSQYGMYATFGAQMTDALRLIVGARYSHYEQEELTYSINPDGSQSDFSSWYAPIYEEDALVPSVALTYEINPQWSAYASYGQSFRPQAHLRRASQASTPAVPEPGASLDPITGDGYELGVKGTLFDAVNAAFAVYRVERNGEGVLDPAYAFTPGNQGSQCCFIANADVTSQGLDIEFSGRVLPGLQVFAGYTFTEMDHGAVAKGTMTVSELSVTPEHLFKMWTTWTLPGELSNWTMSAGVNAQTQYTKLGSAAVYDGLGNVTGFVPYDIVQSGYAIWNASVQYRVNSHWSAAVYAENLFDKTYYGTLGTTNWGSIYGSPRNVILRVQGKF